jgi:uncharacterized protein (DUF1697 family)
MRRYVAFLRAINVGGRNVTMERLRVLVTSLGYANVETFIASGNVIFASRSQAVSAMERKIERCLKNALGFEVAVFIRTAAELASVANFPAFPAADIAAARAFNVAFLKQAPGPGQTKRVMEFRTAIDEFRVNGHEIYWLCRKGQSDSTFSNAALEKALGIQATLRSITTVRKLSMRHPPAGSKIRSP